MPDGAGDSQPDLTAREFQVAEDVADRRALAAGGSIVRTATTPTSWTIADPEGNEVDITFSVGREEHFRADVS